MLTKKTSFTTLTEVTLEVDQILDNLNKIDYDYLVEGLIARKIIEPNEKYSQRVRETTLGESEFIKSMSVLKNKYYQLDIDFITLINELARKF